MVCEVVCLPVITFLAYLCKLMGLPEGVLGIFLGALLVGLGEIEGKLLRKIAERKGKEVLFPFQTAILIIINLIVGAVLVTIIQI